MEKLKKFYAYLLKHKIITLIVVVALVGGVYYYKSNQSQAVTSYVLAKAEKGTIVTSISGSGQVSASNQLEIKPKVSSDVVLVAVKKGQEVKAGTLLIQLDSSEAAKTVRNAQTSLETAKLDLDKLLKPTDELTLLQAENSLAQAQESEQTAEYNLVKSYDDGFNAVTNAFLDLPGLMQGLYSLMYGQDLTVGQDNINYYYNLVGDLDSRTVQYLNDATTQYTKAKALYDKNFTDYKATSRTSDQPAIENLINETYLTVKSVSEAVKDVNNFLDFVSDVATDYNKRIPGLMSTHQTSLDSYTSKTNTHVGNLYSASQAIENYKSSIVSAKRSVVEKELSLTDTKAAPDELDVRAKKISIQQAQDALTSANQTLSYYYIRAPFDGTIAAVNVKKGDTASSGTAVVTLITKQQIAEISLNEVDAAKVKLGQKATLTFDAVENLTITGQVIDVDSMGTVSSGVVTYDVKISFDTQDERVKPGMTVSTAIITESKQDVLVVPSGAVKTKNNVTYVEVLNQGTTPSATNSSQVTSTVAPTQKTVEIGLSGDTQTEITSGLAEGDQVVTKTVTTSSSSSKTTSSSSKSTNSSLLNVGGGGPPGGF
ncbi:MAG: efflux RND transporter periplasmic adaptor subunit [Candidatus Buchananbacteria bacterium]